MTMCRDWSGMTAAAGTSRAGAGWPIATRSRANWPGVMRQVRVRHRGARVDGPAAAVQRVVDEVERAVTVEMAVAVEADRDVVVRRTSRRMARAARPGNRLRSCRSRDRSGRARRSSPAASSGSVPPRLPLTRLPIETRCAPMRPVNGAVTRENSRSSRASAMARLGGCRWRPRRLRWSAARWSTVSAVPNSVRFSCCARHSSRLRQRDFGLRGLELRDWPGRA